MRHGLLIGLLLLAGCARPSLRAERVSIQRDVKRLESKLDPELPIYVEGFDKLLEGDSASIPEEVYVHVIRWLSRMKDAEIRDRVVKDLDHATMMDEPASARGKFVRIQGYIARVWSEPVRLERFPRSKIYAAIVFVDNRYPVVMHFIETPPMVYLFEDMVSLDGLFLKTIHYELKGGGTMRAPFIVGRRILKYD